MKYITTDKKEFVSKEEALLWENNIPNHVLSEKPAQLIPKTNNPKYNQYVIRAKKKKLLFSLSIEEFEKIISSDCLYCGEPNSSTVDRIDSKKGYTVDNCAPCCITCNMMKFTSSKESFLNQIKKIYRYNFA